MVHAKLFEVILRSLDHLIDDLLVDGALHVAVSMSARGMQPFPRRCFGATDHHDVRHGACLSLPPTIYGCALVGSL